MHTKLERIQKDIEALAVFNATPGKGLTRQTFTPEHRAAEDYLRQAMEAAGLTVRLDPVGTLIGRLEGTEPDLPPVAAGSHYDSVPNGGNFDGQAGVVMALETARVFQDLGIKPRRSVDFMALIEEEGARFGGGLFSSRAMAGRLSAEELNTYKDKDGVSCWDAMQAYGLDPKRFQEAVLPKGSLHAFVEMHIEQGKVLETAGQDVGIVQTIVGIKEVHIVIHGCADHAGATPMDMRADAFQAACKVALAANQAAKDVGYGTVATVGKLNVYPGGFNIVPGLVDFYVDIRSPRADCLDAVYEKVCRAVEEACAAEEGLHAEVGIMLGVGPARRGGHHAGGTSGGSGPAYLRNDAEERRGAGPEYPGDDLRRRPRYAGDGGDYGCGAGLCPQQGRPQPLPGGVDRL